MKALAPFCSQSITASQLFRLLGPTKLAPTAGTWALAVLRCIIDELGFPPDRPAATGFGEYRPFDPANTPEARARDGCLTLT